MVIADNNKSSYFYTQFEYPYHPEVDQEEEISLKMDLIFTSLKANQIFRYKKDGRVSYLFGTDGRFRRGKVSKLIGQHLIKQDLIEKYRVKSLLKKEFFRYIEKREKIEDIKLSVKLSDDRFSDYSGKDIEILNNRKNWFPWQTQIYNLLFFGDGTVRPATSRTVVFIYDPVGLSGKSLYWKWLSYKYSQQEVIGYLALASSSQLRSALQSCRNRQIYICDIPRSLSAEDTKQVASLMGVVEDIKNGLLISHMYGRHSLLYQDSSHVIVSSNFLIDPGALSQDRWLVYKMSPDKKLVDISEKVKKQYQKKVSSTDLIF
jgi:hypothetical protein